MKRIIITEPITTDTTWENNIQYIIKGSINVEKGVTLTIKSPVEIGFYPESNFSFKTGSKLLAGNITAYFVNYQYVKVNYIPKFSSGFFFNGPSESDPTESYFQMNDLKISYLGNPLQVNNLTELNFKVNSINISNFTSAFYLNRSNINVKNIFLKDGSSGGDIYESSLVCENYTITNADLGIRVSNTTKSTVIDNFTVINTNSGILFFNSVPFIINKKCYLDCYSLKMFQLNLFQVNPNADLYIKCALTKDFTITSSDPRVQTTIPTYAPYYVDVKKLVGTFTISANEAFEQISLAPKKNVVLLDDLSSSEPVNFTRNNLYVIRGFCNFFDTTVNIENGTKIGYLPPSGYYAITQLSFYNSTLNIGNIEIFPVDYYFNRINRITAGNFTITSCKGKVAGITSSYIDEGVVLDLNVDLSVESIKVSKGKIGLTNSKISINHICAYDTVNIYDSVINVKNMYVFNTEKGIEFNGNYEEAKEIKLNAENLTIKNCLNALNYNYGIGTFFTNITKNTIINTSSITNQLTKSVKINFLKNSNIDLLGNLEQNINIITKDKRVPTSKPYPSPYKAKVQKLTSDCLFEVIILTENIKESLLKYLKDKCSNHKFLENKSSQIDLLKEKLSNLQSQKTNLKL